MYILKTIIHSNKIEIKSIFDNFKDALIAAEHVVTTLNSIMNLTRHSSCESPINHCDYYADLYNEFSITVEKK